MAHERQVRQLLPTGNKLPFRPGQPLLPVKELAAADLDGAPVSIVVGQPDMYVVVVGVAVPGSDVVCARFDRVDTA